MAAVLRCFSSLALFLLGVDGLRRKSKLNQAQGQQQDTFRAKMLVEVNQESPIFPGEHANINIGLGIGGGGSRAMSFSMGALRALEHLGLMGKFDAISAVSGGAWLAAPYMFQTKYSVKELLGPTRNPASLTLDELEKPSARMNDVCSKSTLAKLAKLKVIYPDHQVWERLISDVITGPFDLGERSDMYMAGSDEHRSDIIKRNPQLEKKQFHVPVSGRPKVFIMGGLITAPTGYETDYHNAVPYQMSPDYSGTPVTPFMHYTPHSSRDRDIDTIVGGGFIETFAHGSREPSSQSRSGEIVVQKPSGYSMSLTTAVAITSSTILHPRRDTWPVTPGGKTQEAIEFEYADGGISENLGLLALLARKTRKAVQISSSDAALNMSIDWCRDRSEEEWKQIHGTCVDSNCQLASMFGYEYDSGRISVMRRNKVFPRERAQPMFCRMQRLKEAGKSMVFMETFPVLENKWYGIQGGFDVQVVFIVLDVSLNFEKSLPTSMQAELMTNDIFKGHPHYSVFHNTDTIKLERPVSNLLAAQGEYFVMQNEGLLRELLR